MKLPTANAMPLQAPTAPLRQPDPMAPVQAPPEVDAAKDFEAVLLRQLLGVVRQSLASINQKSEYAGSMFHEMLDEQLAQSMADGGGLGLQEMLADEMRTISLKESAPAVDILDNEGERP